MAKKRYMMRKRVYRLVAVLVLTAFVPACQKETIPQQGLRLVAEGMGGNGTKMVVDGTVSYWKDGDSVNVDGTGARVNMSVEEGQLENYYVGGEYDAAATHCLVFPNRIFRGSEGGTVTVDMPAVYHYTTAQRDMATVYHSYQVLDAPMAYYGTASDGKVLMRHLTGALDVKITGPSGISVESITVGTTQNRVLSGEMAFDLTDLDGIGQSTTNATAHNTVQMLFDRQSFGTGTVQIPIPALTGDVNFTVKVVARVQGTKYTFERTQTTGGHLGRGVLGTVMVNLNEGAEGVTTSALFPTTTMGGKTYYQISTPQDLQRMSDAVFGNTYREDGDTYEDRWSYGGLDYHKANYLVMNDIDMAGYLFTSITGLSGEFNGGGHTISHLTVTGTRYNNSYYQLVYPTHWGVFASYVYGETVTVKDVTFDYLTLNVRTNIGYDTRAGALFGASPIGSCTVEDVNITHFRLAYGNGGTAAKNWWYCRIGGFFGQQGGTASISNSSVQFDADQDFVAGPWGAIYVGGIVGYRSSPSSSLELDGVTAGFGTMDYASASSCYFGGICGYSTDNITASNTSVAGAISFPTTNSNANKVGPSVATMDGVSVSGLTISVK